MKLKEVKIQRLRRKGKTISFSKAGLVTFTSFFTEEDVKGKKYVRFFQDEEDPICWYINFNNESGNQLRIDRGRAMVNSISICRKVKKSTNNDVDKTLKARIGSPSEEGGMMLYPLLIEIGEVIAYEGRRGLLEDVRVKY